MMMASKGKVLLKNSRTNETESVYVDDSTTESSVLLLLRCGADLWARGWDTCEFQVVEMENENGEKRERG